MLKLIKNDLVRILRDKLFLICCIIGAGMAIFTPLLYKVMFSFLDIEELVGMMGLSVTAKSMFFSSFIPSSNMGLIAPMLIAIVLCKDYSQGTVRNKVISGKTRLDIFLSMFISGTLIILLTMMLHGFMTLGFSLLLFDYTGGDASGELGYFFLSLLLETVVYIFISALTAFLCVFMKNAGLCAVVYLGINFLFSIIGSIVMTSFAFADPENKITYALLELLNYSNVFTSTLIGSGTSYLLKEILYTVIPSVFGTALFLGLGILVFRRKDLK